MKIFLPFAILLMCTTSHAGNCLNIQLTDGSTVTIPFSQKPVITYPDYKTIVIATTDGKTSYTFDGSISYSYSTENTTGVQVLEARTKITDGKLLVNGMEPGETVTAYTLDGQVIASVKAGADGSAILSTENIQNTVLVVKTATTSFKMKK